MGRHKKVIEEDNTEEKDIDETEDDKVTEKILISSGCSLLNLALSNDPNYGYRAGRIVNIVGDKSSGKCTKNAYILNDNGISHLDTQFATLEEGTSEFKQKLVVNKNEKAISTHGYKEKVKKTIKITTRHGYEIECTPNHPILTFSSDCKEELKQAKNCKENTIAIIEKGTNHFGDNGKCDENLSFLLGIIVANGINPKYGRIDISTSKEYLHKKIQEVTSNLGYKAIIHKDKKGIGIYNKEFSLYIWETFFNKKEDFTARVKFVPQQILSSPRNVQIYFLRGLIDCDSFCNIKNNYLEYYTASELLAKQVHLMLLNLGILSNRQSKTGSFIGETFYDHKYWTISFGGKYLNLYAKEIGSDKYKFNISTEKSTSDFDSIPFLLNKMINDRENLKIKLGWLKNGKLRDGSRFNPFKTSSQINVTYDFLKLFINKHEKYKNNFDILLYKNILKTEYHYDPIVKIETIEYKEGTYVYDVHVPETHLFWCNGFISHNTLLAIEVMSYAYHMMKKNYDMKLIYDEGEAAFDKEYAAKLGLPVDIIDFRESETVEQWYESLEKEVNLSSKEKKDFTIYVLDSLDALVSEEEMEQDFNKAGFGMSKQKQMSKLFRRLVRKLRTNNILLIIISQLRDKIGVTFGETKTRAGGRALDFYASQIIWLYEIKKVKKGNLTVGIDIKAKVKKNKLWKPFREVSFSILFEYGIDDVGSNIDYLKENKKCVTDAGSRFSYENNNYSREEFIQFIGQNNREQEIKNLVKMTWDEIEEECKVIRKPKYQDEENDT